MECYEISMKSSARKSWKQLVARIKEVHSSYAVIRMLSAWGCLVHQMAGILIPLNMEPVLGWLLMLWSPRKFRLGHNMDRPLRLEILKEGAHRHFHYFKYEPDFIAIINHIMFDEFPLTNSIDYELLWIKCGTTSLQSLICGLKLQSR